MAIRRNQIILKLNKISLQSSSQMNFPSNFVARNYFVGTVEPIGLAAPCAEGCIVQFPPSSLYTLKPLLPAALRQLHPNTS
jgi:hypothetical protein